MKMTRNREEFIMTKVENPKNECLKKGVNNIKIEEWRIVTTWYISILKGTTNCKWYFSIIPSIRMD